MLRGLEGWHIVIILAIVVLLFGSRKLPDAARSMGQSLRIFKSEMKAAAKDDAPAANPQPTASAVPQAVENTAVNPNQAQTTGTNDAVPSHADQR